MSETFTSKNAFKVGSTKKLALGLLGYYRSIEEALNCILSNIADSDSWAVDLDDGADGAYRYYDLISTAATAANTVVTEAEEYAGLQTTTANEASYRADLTADIDTFNTAFDNVLELFGPGITTGGTPTWGGVANAAAFGDSSTNAGLLMNMPYEDQVQHAQNVKILADAFNVSLSSVVINLGSVDKATGTSLSTLHNTNYSGFITAAYTMNCKLVALLDQLEMLIANQKINGTLMTTTPSAALLTAANATQTQWATTDAAVDTIFTTINTA
jgi:hypothetical protein